MIKIVIILNKKTAILTILFPFYKKIPTFAAV